MKKRTKPTRKAKGKTGAAEPASTTGEPKPNTEPLTAQEEADLRRYETQIEEGKDAWLDMTAALEVPSTAESMPAAPEAPAPE